MPEKSKPQPYRINYQAGYHYFETDQDILYACGFHDLTSRLPPMLGVYDIKISDFEFFPVTGEKGITAPDAKHDPRVSATLVDLLDGYFQDKHQVLIYLCEAGDGRPRQRQALFSRWARQSVGIEHQPVVIAAGEFAVYGGMLTRKDFPYPDVLQEHLVDRAGELILEKFGT